MPALTLLSLVAVVVCFSFCSVLADDDCFRIATFNAGLLASVANYTQRAPLIPQALLNNDADIYCLQEFWLESQVEDVLDIVGHVYPHHFSKIHVDTDTLSDNVNGTEIQSACSISDLTTYATTINACIGQHCLQAYASSLLEGTACLSIACAHILASDDISADCIQCLIQYATGLGVGGEECFPNLALPRNRLNAPGLILLSKTPLNATYSSYHDAELEIERGYIEANVEGLGTVVCTHLTSQFPVYFEYNRIYQNYSEQYQAEVDTLISTFALEDHILVGDLNTGLAIPEKNITADFGHVYEQFLEAGYQNPYVDEVGECTFCGHNQLTTVGTDRLIDHVLLYGDLYEGNFAKRILDTEDPMFLSDHFGLEVNVCPGSNDDSIGCYD